MDSSAFAKLQATAQALQVALSPALAQVLCWCSRRESEWSQAFNMSATCN
jgi:hypothetical protein